MKKGIAIFFIAILILSNVYTIEAYAQLSSGTDISRITRDFRDPRFDNSLSDPRLRTGFELGGDQITLGVDQESDLGEDIVINIDQHVPDRIVASLLEKQDIYVRSLLVGFPSNPSITIPRIRDVRIRVTNVTTEPVDKKVRVSARYINPRGGARLSRDTVRSDPTFNNLGYIQTIIRRIPKEEDVPNTIKINLDATINFDVSEGLGFGPREDILVEQTEEEWLREKEQHSFFGGFIRASEVKSDRASFIIYDDNLNPITTRAITIGRGSTSGVILKNGYSRFGNIFNRFRIRVNDIRSVGEKVKLLIYRDSTNEFSTRVLSKGSNLFPGSNWILEDIRTKDDKTKEVLLRNRRTRETKLLPLQQIVCEDLSIQECINFDVCSLVGDKCIQRDDCSKLTLDKCEINPQCSINTQTNSCERKVVQQQIKSCSDAGGICSDYFCPANQRQIGESTEFGCGSLEIVDENTGDITNINRVCCVPLNEQDKQFIEQEQDINEIIKKYSEISRDKEADTYLASVNDLINNIKSNFFDAKIKLELKSRASNLLKNILRDLNDLRGKYQIENNKEKLNTITGIINDLIGFLGQQEELQTSISEVAEPEAIKDLYQLAVQEYENAVRDYPNIQDENTGDYYSIKALKRIAQLYYSKLNDETKAIQAYEALLNNPNFPDEEKHAIQTEINLLKGVLKNLGTKPITLKDDTEEVIVKLLDIPIVQKDLESRATIEINNIRKVVKEGDFLTDEAQEPFKWRVKSIGETTRLFRSRDVVELERIETDNTGRTITRTDTITSSIKSIPIAKDKTIRVRLVNLDLKREVHITIVPDSERAISESSFSLNIPVEKRAIRPSIFSDSLDDEINKTKKLIEKVDKLVKDLEKIHKFWINFCYVTFGTLWSKNLIQNAFLSNQGIARQKIRDKWVSDYNAARTDTKDPFRGSFDQYVLKNREKYEQELEQAESIIDRVQRGEYTSAIPEDMARASEDQKKNWFFSREMASINRDRYTDAKVDAEVQARVEHIGAEIEGLKKKDFDSIKKQLEDECGFVGITKDQYKTNKLGYLNTCKKRLVSKTISKYFVNQETDNLPESLMTEDINRICGDGCPENVITNIKRKYDDFFGLQQREFGVFDTIVQGGSRKLVISVGSTKQLYNDNKCTSELTGDVDIKGTYYVKDYNNQPCGPIRFGVKPKFQPINKFSVVKSTDLSADRAKGLVEFISIDALLYAQASYTRGRDIKSITIFERPTQNGPLGTGDLVGSSDELKKNCALKDKSKILYSDACSSITKVERDIRNCNSELSKKLLDVGGICKGYAREDVQPTEVGQSCVDFMTPSDCALLFNACDPVMCPSSRCNLNGQWYVREVVQTGIVGSLALCLPNFGNPLDGGVAVPICITGLRAGLENIKSMLQGYEQCLSTHKVSGESVGICDRIRNVHLCDILWREGIAILNIKGGLLGLLSEKIFDTGKGGGEYANFKNAIDNSINGLRFFTQDYAKNVFAAYSGGSLDEIGTEICKTAVFGKLPGPGFFDQITRPVSPPQFIAFFDEIPYSDVGRQESQYSVFHHIYAGANEDIRFSIFLRAVNERGESYLPIQYVLHPGNRRLQNQQLDKGSFSEENNEFIALSGYNQVCVQIDQRVSGRSIRPSILECGFGKVTTDFGINYLNDRLIEREAQKQITTAEECVPEAGRLTNLNYQSGIGISEVVASAPGAALGTFSTGLLQTGIVRKCSGFNPGIGTNENAWVAVGTCGKDERGRDLGTCWLYSPGVSKLIQDTQRRNLVEQGLKELQQKVAEEGVRGLNVLSDKEIKENFDLIENLLANPSETNFKNIIKLYKEIIVSTLIEKHAAKAQFELAQAYEKWAKFRELQIEIKEQVKVIEQCPNLFDYGEENGKYTYDSNVCPSTCPRKPDGCFCGLNSKWVPPSGICGEVGEKLTREQTTLDEDIFVYDIKGLDVKAQSLGEDAEDYFPNYYEYEKGQWIRDIETELGLVPIEEQRRFAEEIVEEEKKEEAEIFEEEFPEFYQIGEEISRERTRLSEIIIVETVGNNVSKELRDKGVVLIARGKDTRRIYVLYRDKFIEEFISMDELERRIQQLEKQRIEEKLTVGKIIKSEEILFSVGFEPVIREDLEIISIDGARASAKGVISGLLYSFNGFRWNIIEPSRCIVNKLFWDTTEIKDNTAYFKSKEENINVNEGGSVFLHAVTQGEECIGKELITTFYNKGTIVDEKTLYTDKLNVNDPDLGIFEDEESITYKTSYGYITTKQWIPNIKICGDENSLENCKKTIFQRFLDVLFLIEGKNILTFKIEQGPRDAKNNIIESNKLYVEVIKDLQTILSIGEQYYTNNEFTLFLTINHPFDYLSDYRIIQEAFLDGRRIRPPGFENIKYSQLYEREFIKEPYNIQEGVPRRSIISIPKVKFDRPGQLEYRITVVYNIDGREFQVDISKKANILLQECTYKEAYWATEVGGKLQKIQRVLEGQEVIMVLNTEECEDKLLYFKIGDTDFFPSNPLRSALEEEFTTTLQVPLRNNQAKVKWRITKNVCNGLNCEKPPISLKFYVGEERGFLTSSLQSNNVQLVSRYINFNFGGFVYRVDKDANLEIRTKVFPLTWQKVDKIDTYRKIISTNAAQEALKKARGQ